jgi:NitT/TauT family transport system permease protein
VAEDLGSDHENVSTEDTFILPPRARRIWKKSQGFVLPLIGILLALAAWQLVIIVFDIKRFLLPPPSLVFAEFWEERELLRFHAQHTTVGFTAGFLLSVLVGIPVAVCLFSSRWLSGLFYPLIVGSQAVPKVALAPFFLVWVGIGYKSQILIAFLIAVFPILINTKTGLEALPLDMYHLARSMGAGPLRTFFRVRLPFALPMIWAGFRVSITLAVVGAVVGEFVASNQGLGFLIAISTANVRTSLAFAALILLSALAIVAYLIVEAAGFLLIPRSKNLQS